MGGRRGGPPHTATRGVAGFGAPGMLRGVVSAASLARRTTAVGAREARQVHAMTCARGPASGVGDGASAVERLFDRCQEVLGALPNGTAATVADVSVIVPLMDRITPADLGIVPPTRAANPLALRLFGRSGPGPGAPRYPPLEYLKLHDCAAFTMGVFRFPENGTIPLHDHPGMTVVSKLLYGRVRVLSYDWAEAESPSTTRVPRRARLVADRIIQAPIQPLSLYPDDANVHMFHALTPAALLDVLAPPYAVGEGRDCHYFAEVPRGPNGEACGENEAWLLETECPESFEVNRGTYLGPKVGSEAEAG